MRERGRPRAVALRPAKHPAPRRRSSAPSLAPRRPRDLSRALRCSRVAAGDAFFEGMRQSAVATRPRAPSGHGRPRSFYVRGRRDEPPEALAWLVVFQAFFLCMTTGDIADSLRGSVPLIWPTREALRRWINRVCDRYEECWHVASARGFRIAPPANKALTCVDDMDIVDQIVDSPRTLLKGQHGIFCEHTGNTVSYSTFCKVVARLGLSRQKARSPPPPRRAHARAAPTPAIKPRPRSSLEEALRHVRGPMARECFYRCHYKWHSSQYRV